MAVYDLYGFSSEDIHLARNLLEASLGIQFEARNSDYQAGDYFQSGKASDEHFVLKRNVDLIDGEPSEMQFPEHKVLFYVNDTLRSAALLEQIKKAGNFALLRHEDLE